ncbi:hypothetical protein EDD28_0071 [Salana multivorans]|uniref:Gp37 protein n=1 Tax=Salana multivorans TaxID=120377 RepID=A0A3N2D6Y9_9MICO|nr:hypothetical protein [Salana multivorans]ROR95515.1 hypothetical protein EDD28_0071 [Salana multivorans]
MGTLPQSVLDEIDSLPLEDVAKPLLQAAVPDISVHTFIPMKEVDDLFPFVLVQGYSREYGLDDDRYLDSGLVSVQSFTTGDDGDQDGALVQLAIRRALRRLSAQHYRINDDVSVVKVTLVSRPKRVPDWATATGPVQFADLPVAAWRYESIYRITFRKKPTSE